MPKDQAQPVNPPTGQANQRDHDGAVQEPMSGSKKTKQANHTRHNNAKG